MDSASPSGSDKLLKSVIGDILWIFEIRNFQQFEIQKSVGSFVRFAHTGNDDVKSFDFGPELSLKFYFENPSFLEKWILLITFQVLIVQRSVWYQFRGI